MGELEINTLCNDLEFHGFTNLWGVVSPRSKKSETNSYRDVSIEDCKQTYDVEETMHSGMQDSLVQVYLRIRDHTKIQDLKNLQGIFPKPRLEECE